MLTWIAILLGAMLLARLFKTQLQTPFILTAAWTMVASARLPLRLALRVQTALGVTFVVALVTGAAIVGRPAAALVFAVLVFALTLTWWVQVIGPMVATLPFVAFIIGVAGVARGMSSLEIVRDVVLGTLVGFAFAVITKMRDSRKEARLAVAAAWLPRCPMKVRIAAARMLHLDGHPDDLVALLRDATRTHLGLQFLRDADSPQSVKLVAALEAQTVRIREALQPRGPIVPRELPEWNCPVPDAVRDESLDSTQRLGMITATESIADAAGVLAGTRSSPRGSTYGDALGQEYLQALRHPDPFLLRWAIQRAVVLGLCMLAVVLSHQNLDVVWAFVGVILTLSPFGGVSVGIKRFIGTTGGIILAAVLAAFVPVEILYPYVAVCVFGVGLGFFLRNYAIFAGGLGFFIALVIGLPAHDVALWAGLRSLDTLIGVTVGVIASRAILAPRVSLSGRAQRISTALDAVCSEILRAPQAGTRAEEELRVRIARAEAAVESMESEWEIEAKGGDDEVFAQAGVSYRDALDQLRLTCCLFVGGADSELAASRVHDIQAAYQRVTSQVLLAA